MAAGICSEAKSEEGAIVKRFQVAWSNTTDQIEGPCVVCGKEVHYVIPADRPDPALLFHSTCDPTPMLREKLKSAHPPRLDEAYLIHKSPTLPGQG